MVQFASYLRRVLAKTHLIFSRIGGPIISPPKKFSNLSQMHLIHLSLQIVKLM